MSSTDDVTHSETEPLLPTKSSSVSILVNDTMSHAVQGGASEMAIGAHKEPSWRSRLAMVHLTKVLNFKEYPGYAIMRLLLGCAMCMVVNRGIQCQDNLTSVFNFFLCVNADNTALLEIRQVLIGGTIGTLVVTNFSWLNNNSVLIDL
jgi:hypothetical protein